MGVSMTPRYRIHPDTPAAVLNGQRFGHRDQPTFGQRRQRRRDGGLPLFGQCGGHVDDVAPTALLEHLADDALGDVKEPERVHRRDHRVVLARIRGEGFGDEHPGIVDERVDATEGSHSDFDQPLRGGRVGDIACDNAYFGIV